MAMASTWAVAPAGCRKAAGCCLGWLQEPQAWGTSAAAGVPISVAWPEQRAIIAGGGAAGLTQTATTAVRAASTALTGGLANWIVNTIETIGAFIMAVLAMVLPVLLVAVVAISLLLAGIWFYRRRQRPVVPAV